MKISAVIQNVTNRGKAVSLLNLSLMIVIALMLSGCLAHNPHRHGNPHYDHHEAPRTEVIFSYHYYPDAHVYYDTHRRLYHYHDKYRGWISVRILPGYIHLGGHRRHIVHSKHNKPWKLKHRNKRPHSHIAPGQRRPHNEQQRPHNDKRRPHNDQQRPHNDKRRPHNDQQRPHNDKRRPQQRPNKNQRYRPSLKPLQKPNQHENYRPAQKPIQKPTHDEQRHSRQKKQQNIKIGNKIKQRDKARDIKLQKKKNTTHLKKNRNEIRRERSIEHP